MLQRGNRDALVLKHVFKLQKSRDVLLNSHQPRHHYQLEICKSTLEEWYRKFDSQHNFQQSSTFKILTVQQFASNKSCFAPGPCGSHWGAGYDNVSRRKSEVYKDLRTEPSLPLTGVVPQSHGPPGRRCPHGCCWPSTTAWCLRVCQLPETPYMGLSVLTLWTARHSMSITRKHPAAHNHQPTWLVGPSLSSQTPFSFQAFLGRTFSFLRWFWPPRAWTVTQCLQFLQLVFMAGANARHRKSNGFARAT